MSNVWAITGAGEWGGGDGWWVVHGGEAVFGMLVFAVFPGVKIRPFA